jgi:hypothetical protein
MEDKDLIFAKAVADIYNRYYDDNDSIYNNMGSSNTYNPHSMAEQAFQNDVPKDHLQPRWFMDLYWSKSIIPPADRSWSDVATIKNLIKLNAAIEYSSGRRVLEKEFFAPEDFVAEHKEMNIPWSRFYNAGKEVVWLEQDMQIVQVLFVESKQNPGTMIPFLYQASFHEPKATQVGDMYKHVFTNPRHEWSIQIIQNPGETYRNSNITSRTQAPVTAALKQHGIDYNAINNIIQGIQNDSTYIDIDDTW